MQKKHFMKLLLLIFVPFLTTTVFAKTTSQTNKLTLRTQALHKAAPKLNKDVIKLALTAYDKARHEGLDKKQILTVVDYQIPDTKKRMWVFNVAKDKLLFHTLVPQGKGTGLVYAEHFSNRPHTLESSLGLFLTGKSYYGNDGYSLRLKGLSGKFNDNAYRRTVVMHGAWYVSPKFVKKYHHLGRSWGCLALDKNIVKPVVNTIKNGTLIFSYDNKKNFLEHGPFIRHA